MFQQLSDLEAALSSIPLEIDVETSWHLCFAQLSNISTNEFNAESLFRGFRDEHSSLWFRIICACSLVLHSSDSMLLYSFINEVIDEKDYRNTELSAIFIFSSLKAFPEDSQKILLKCIHNLDSRHEQDDGDTIGPNSFLLEILSTFFSGSQSSESLLAILEAVYSTLIHEIEVKILALPDLRVVVIKSVMIKLLSCRMKFPGNSNIEDVVECIIITTWELSQRLLAQPPQSDVISACMLICISLTEFGPAVFNILGRHHHLPSLWTLVLSGMLHNDPVTRKRCAYILQQLPLLNPSPNILVPTETVKSICGKRPWWSDYLQAYHQIEGCSNLHLVSQVWPHIEHLCAVTAALGHNDVDLISNTAAVSDRSGLMWGPQLGFSWMTALFRLLLRAQVPSVRKATVAKILSGAIQVSATEVSARWVCEDLLPLLDNPIFFRSEFFEPDDSAMSSAKADIIALYPGVLLPAFMLNFMQRLTVSADDFVTERHLALTVLIRGLLITISGARRDISIQSLNATKFSVRAFWSTCPLLRLLPRCLGREHMHLVRHMLRDKMAAINDATRRQVLRGLAPLLLASVDPVEAGGLLPVLRMFDSLGWDRVLESDVGVTLLADVIQLALAHRSLEAAAAAGEVSPADWSLLSLSACILPTSSGCDKPSDDVSKSVLPRLAESVIKTLLSARGLYSSPYAATSAQRHLVWAVEGVARVLWYIGKETIARSQFRGIDVIVETTASVAVDIASFLVELLKASMVGRASNLPAPVVETLEDFRACVNGLGSLLLLPQNLSPSGSPFAPSLSYEPLLVIITNFMSDCVTGLTASATETENRCDRSLLSSLKLMALSDLIACVRFAWCSVGPPNLRRNWLSKSSCDALCGCIQTTSSALFFLPPPSHSTFQASLSSQAAATGEPAIIKALLRHCGQFGRLSAMEMSYRWSGLSDSLALLSALLSISGSTLTSQDQEMRGSAMLDEAARQLDVAAPPAVPNIISCASVAADFTLSLGSTAVQDSTLISAEKIPREVFRSIPAVFDCAWRAMQGFEDVEVKSYAAFIRMLTTTPMLTHMDSETILEYSEKVFLYCTERPFLVRLLVTRLCDAWTADPSLFPAFAVTLVPQLVTYKESVLDDHKATNADDGSDGGMAVRVTVLRTLEGMNAPGEALPVETILATRRLLLHLLRLNNSPAMCTNAVLGSEKFGSKLRLWQALCVLSVFVTEQDLQSEEEGGEGLMDMVLTALRHNCVHSIRVHMEIFAAAMCEKFPRICLSELLGPSCLSCYNHSQQTLASYFVVLGLWCENSLAAYQKGNETDIREVFPLFALRVVDCLVPWVTCAPGLARAVAQVVGHRLIPAVLDLHDMDSGKKEMLRGIFRFLDENADAVKLRQKQLSFFTAYSLQSKRTTEGLLTLEADLSGERIPTHVLTILNAAIKKEADEAGSDAKPVSAAEAERESVVSLQSKIVPFDALQLDTNTSVMLSRSNNVSKRPRQRVIVCASLVDKATNVAGIVRTCEVFAVERLVVGDLGVVRSEAFKGVAMSADMWLPLAEVKESALTEYLRDCRKRGYCILGLEQAEGSRMLGRDRTTGAFPSKCVLLLGKEKEGVPAHLLGELDGCLEIPQYGVTRSLNVHVSAAIAIWELTKSNTSQLEGIK